MAEVSVRDATVDDAVAIAVAHTFGWQKAYRGIVRDDCLDAMDLDLRTEYWRKNLEMTALPDGTPAPHIYVAEIDGSVGAFAAVGVLRRLGVGFEHELQRYDHYDVKHDAQEDQLGSCQQVVDALALYLRTSGRNHREHNAHHIANGHRD